MNNIELESIDTPEFRVLLGRVHDHQNLWGCQPEIRQKNRANFIAHINERMAAYGAQQREDERLRIKEIDDAYQRSSGAANWQDRAEKAEAAVKEARWVADERLKDLIALQSGQMQAAVQLAARTVLEAMALRQHGAEKVDAK